MPQDDIAPSLEIDQDPRAQRREWRFERAGWFIIAILMAAAAAGLFGDGPVARVTWQSPAAPADSVEYDRIDRFGTATTISATIAATSSADTMAMVALDRKYAESVEIQHIVPEPVETRASGEWVAFLFRRAMPGRPIKVDFTVAPVPVGRLHGVMLVNAARLDMPQFVLP